LQNCIYTMALKYLLYFSFLILSTTVSSQESKILSSSAIDHTFSKLNHELKNVIANQNKQDIIQARYKLGAYCKKIEVYPEAINQFSEALSLYEKRDIDTTYVSLLLNLGVINLNIKDYDAALSFFQKGALHAKSLNDSSKIAYAKSNIGTCYEKKGDYKKALEYQRRSLTIYKSLGDNEGKSIVNENIGSIHEDLEEFELAKSYFENALALHNQDTDIRYSNIINNIGDIYRKTGFLKEGLAYTKQSLMLAQHLGDKVEEASAYKDLSKNYSLSGDFKKANKALNTYIALDIENRKRQNANQASALQQIYDTKEKESQIQLLLQNSKVDKAHKSLLYLVIIVVLVFSLIWYFYILRKRKETKKVIEYEQRILKSELEKKQIEEDNLQKEVDLKNSALSRYSLHLSQKNKILSNLSQTLKNSLSRTNIDLKRKLKEVVSEIDFNLAQEHEWDEFMIFFKEIHPDYIKKITKRTKTMVFGYNVL